MQVILIGLHCGSCSKDTSAQVLSQSIQTIIFKNVLERVQVPQLQSSSTSYDQVPLFTNDDNWVNFDLGDFDVSRS